MARIQPGTVLVVLWAGLCTLAPIANNDIWIHLKVGEDVLAQHRLPFREVYSALAEGNLYVAHEWLTAVLFHLVAMLPGPPGAALSVLQCLLAVSGLVILYRTLAPEARRSPLALWMLFLSANVVICRASLRPHLVSWVIEAGIIFAIERWRRAGGRALLGLVPVMLIWANLHAGALFGEVVLVLLAVGVVAAVRWPRLALGEPRVYGLADARIALLTAVGGGIACLLTPYGWRIPALALGLNASPVVRSRVYEWQSPFSNHLTLYIAAYFSMVALSWALLLFRGRKVQIVDLLFAAFGTAISFRSTRYMPEALVLCLPGAARAWAALLRERGTPPHRWPIAEGAVGLFLVVTALTYGYPISPGEHRPIGWGYGGRQPYAEVAFLEAQHLHGTIFNEYADGGLIIHDLYPAIRPVMDSRNDVYGDALFREYLEALFDPVAFDAFVQRHDVQLALLEPRDENREVVDHVATSPNWHLLFKTADRVLYGRQPLPSTDSAK